ncbi:MAG: hypothetical protein AB2693_21285 [Candidatus Thiodiazotropha sp.]
MAKRHEKSRLSEDFRKLVIRNIIDFGGFLIAEKPSISLGEIKENLLAICNIEISKPTICRYLRKRRTRKLLVRPAADRFKDTNLRSASFHRCLHSKDAAKIKFFDESGFALPDVTNPRYGRAQKPSGHMTLK